jgi:hypothetical protein
MHSASLPTMITPHADEVINPWIRPDRNAVILAARDNAVNEFTQFPRRKKTSPWVPHVVQDLHPSGPLCGGNSWTSSPFVRWS